LKETRLSDWDDAGTVRGEKIALTNVRVFDGRELRGPATVIIEGGIVGDDSAGARVIDAGGATLLPGLIDAHVHLLGEPGRRADLVLIDGDPIADIRATRQIRRVWCAGVEHRVAYAA
jgi:imidazolonepropionase-like amidohydrolase